MARCTPRSSGSEGASSSGSRAKWGVSDNNRRARFYTLTRAGRDGSAQQANRWHRLAAAMARVLGSDSAQG